MWANVRARWKMRSLRQSDQWYAYLLCRCRRRRRQHVCAHITWWRVKEAANWNCSSLCVYAQHALLLLCICQRAAFDYIQLSESGSRAPQQREDLLLMLRARALSLSPKQNRPSLVCDWGGRSCRGSFPRLHLFSTAVELQIYTMRYVITYVCVRCLWFVLSLSRSAGLSICGEARVSLFHLRQLICAALSLPQLRVKLDFPAPHCSTL